MHGRAGEGEAGELGHGEDQGERSPPQWSLGTGLTSHCPLVQVFLKYYHVEQLNLMVQQATQRVVLLQAYIRGWLGARRYRRTLSEREHSALVLQSGS